MPKKTSEKRRKNTAITNRLTIALTQFLDELPVLLSRCLGLTIAVMLGYNLYTRIPDKKSIVSTQDFDCDAIIDEIDQESDQANNSLLRDRRVKRGIGYVPVDYTLGNGSLVSDSSRWVIIAFSKYHEELENKGKFKTRNHFFLINHDF